jgi:hypothetical protein
MPMPPTRSSLGQIDLGKFCANPAFSVGPCRNLPVDKIDRRNNFSKAMVNWLEHA